ncbi:hypothetical protein FE251_11100 [Georgenia wutianyii]|uniref:Lipoprotein n=1 Tax=Georgenia wutianyii TaxID=2585135 RepID=A0ABX5VNP5_9MICO|nr:hypothetical protein [Georgenia wutianyii]QDB79860.1 hypothetical protein FE251_11100 [Georgenia wutianyii]
MSSSAVAAIVALALVGCAPDEPPPTTVASAVVPTEPARYALCAELPAQPQPMPVERFDGWWNADPTSGQAALDPAEWPDPRMREHPRVAVVDTQSGGWTTWDRTICGQSDEFSPVIEKGWPDLSYVVVDLDTGEVLESAPIADVDGGAGLRTTSTASADIEANGWDVLGADEAAPYAALVREDDPWPGLRFVHAAKVTPTAVGGVYESADGVGFTFRLQREERMGDGGLAGREPRPLQIDGAEGWTYAGASWAFVADAVTPGCSASVHAVPVSTDVPPWPEGYDDYLAGTVLPRLLQAC